MKFLLNMNLPRELGRRLASLGHTWRHVGDIGLASVLDERVVAEARQTREVILTHDLDYGAILAFSGEDAPSVWSPSGRRTRHRAILRPGSKRCCPT